jgi:predicted dehydrogenase
VNIRTSPHPTLLFMGAGAAARIHSRVLAKHHPETRKCYISRSLPRAEALARQAGGSVYERGWEAAMQDPEIDVVVITTPPSTHLDLTLKALAAGKHVIVEKPAFLESEDFDWVEAAAARAERQVLVAENYHYKPLARRLRGLIESGELGQIRIVEINAVKQQHAEGWRLDPEMAGGGALFEGGIHWVSLMANLGLEVTGVRGFFPDAPAGHERSAVLAMEYAQGAVGVLTYSWEIPSTLRGLRLSRIWGTRGSLLFESNGLFAVRSGGVPRPFLPGLSDIQGYRTMMADFMRALVTGAPPDFTLQAARKDVELIRSAYAESTQPIGR